MVQNRVNDWTALRFALAYPGEAQLALFRESFDSAPATLEQLQAIYINLFEAGLPQPRCPLIESCYVLNRPAGEVVLENKLFYRHFGLEPASHCAPDHLLTQLEFLSWLDTCIDAGNAGRESLERAKRDFIDRHMAHWVPRVARMLSRGDAHCFVDASCYGEVFEALAESLAGVEEMA